MNGDLDLEQRYRRVLRLLPAYYRSTWEQDMVAAFLESSLTGHPDEDEWVLEFSKTALAGGHKRGGPGLPAVPGRLCRPPGSPGARLCGVRPSRSPCSRRCGALTCSC